MSFPWLNTSQHLAIFSFSYTSNQQDVQLTLSSGTVANLQTFAIYAINHENFEYFNPIEAPPEPTTEGSFEMEDDARGEGHDGSGSKVVTSGTVALLLLLLVSTVLQRPV